VAFSYLALTKLITFLTTQNPKGKPIAKRIKRFKSVKSCPAYAKTSVAKVSPNVIIVPIFLTVFLSDLYYFLNHLALTKLITFLTTQNPKGKPIAKIIITLRSVKSCPVYAKIPSIDPDENSIIELIFLTVF